MNDSQIKLKRVSILFSEREIDILKYIMKEKGYHTLPSTVRACVDGFYTLQYYNKRYMTGGVSVGKDVVEENKEEELTDEQYCDLRGGKFNAVRQTCAIAIGNGSIISVPVTDRKGIDEALKQKLQAEEFNKNRKVIKYE